MPDVLLHFALPFALSSPFLGLRRAIIIGMIALVPDLDVLFHVHRSASHSIAFLTALSLPLVVLTAIKAPSLKSLCTAGFTSLVSHPILDAFQTYTPLLYPIIEESMYLRLSGGFLLEEGLKPYLQASLQMVQANFAPFTSFDAVVFTSQSFSISIALITIPILGRILTNKSALEGSKEISLRGDETKFVRELENLKEELTVVIPTLNEEKAIGNLIDEIKAEGFENILVVDGYSKDRTVEIAISKGAKVVFQHGSGKAGALKTAIEHVRTPLMLIMDGDGTYDPKDIKRMLVHADKYDEVIGARANPENMPVLHRFGNWLINLAFRWLIGSNLSDVCSGMYLLKTKSLKGISIGRGFNVDVEIAAHMVHSGKVTEVPINYRKRIGRRKLKSIRDGISILATVVRLSLIYNPVMVLTSLASLFAIPGAIISIWQLYLRHAYGTWSMGMAWLGLILLVIGLNSFAIAVLSFQLKRIERRILQSLGES